MRSLRPDIPVITKNRGQALSRFFGLEQRLSAPEMSEYAAKFEKKVEALISSGTVVRINQSQVNEPVGMVWYLPIFYVVYPNKPGEIRVVFDAKARFRSTSFNSLMLRGPPSIPSLTGVLLRARQFRFVLSADITAFYHRVGVSPNHQSLQRFVYRKFGSGDHIGTFQFTTLMFGGLPSSSAAVLTLQYAAEQCTEFPQVAIKMKDNFYSDNMIDSFETEEEAIIFRKQVTSCLETGGFSLTAFAASSQRIIDSVPPQRRAASVLDLNLDNLPVEYHLGLELDLKADAYRVRAKPMPKVTTKRELLSAVSLTFDPFGALLPVITGAKMIFQETAKGGDAVRGWDEPLPAILLEKWNKWATKLTSLDFPSVNRCFRPKSFPVSETVYRLVLMCDAAPGATAAVAYLRAQCEQQVYVSFLMGKGRLSPLQPTTVPRLELQAAVLAVRLSLLIQRELRIPIAAVEYYTDSQIVLWQLHNTNRDRPKYVSKRRDEVLAHSTPDQWHYVRSEDNPADDCTRGITPKDFGPDCRWINGPKFLTDPEYIAPPFVRNSVTVEEEATAVNVNSLAAEPSYCHPSAAAISKMICRATVLILTERQIVSRLSTV